MQEPARLPNDQLLEMLEQQEIVLGQQAVQLEEKDEQLATQDDEIKTKDDIIKQLEQKNEELELAYNKLWRERFEARSERYIRDPNQLCLDFGNTEDAADAAAALADAVEEADLIPAHRRRKPRKKRDEGLPEHLPRYEVTADVSDEVKNGETHGERTRASRSHVGQNRNAGIRASCSQGSCHEVSQIRLPKRSRVWHRFARAADGNRRRQQV